MNPSTALIISAFGVGGLFFLDRDPSVRVSKAVWLPVFWLWIVGSRPVSAWLHIPPEGSLYTQVLDGSPFDRLIWLCLLAAGIFVLIYRSLGARVLSRVSWPILLYFLYCLMSVLWSDFPDVAFKRWTKALGDLVMVLIVVTDTNPLEAFKRLLSRVGFILMPASVLVTKYFGEYGRVYDPFLGLPIDTGVAIDKNMLGVTTFVLSLGALWQILTLLREPRRAHRNRRLLAQCTLLAFGCVLLVMAHSVTAAVCFALGAGIILATAGLPVSRLRPGVVHALVLGILLAGALTISLGGEASVVHALGKNTNLTGRSAIWEAVVPMAPNPLVGAGFESFWLGPRLDAMWRRFPVFRPNEAHNGYLEVYLNLGWVGLLLIALILITGYWRAAAAFRRDPAFGALMVAYVITAAFYSITEAGFRMLDTVWIFLLFALVASGTFAEDSDDGQRKPAGSSETEETPSWSR